jgi:hypothetical protein
MHNIPHYANLKENKENKEKIPNNAESKAKKD